MSRLLPLLARKKKRGRCSHPIRAGCQVDGASYVFLSHVWGQPWQTPRLDAVFPGPWRRMPTARLSIGGNISPRAPPHGQGPSPATNPMGKVFSSFVLAFTGKQDPACLFRVLFGTNPPMRSPPCRANHLLSCKLGAEKEGGHGMRLDVNPLSADQPAEEGPPGWLLQARANVACRLTPSCSCPMVLDAPDRAGKEGSSELLGHAFH